MLWKNNLQGFRYNLDVLLEPETGTIRILSLGDSFVAGYRLGQNETFSALLEKYFNSKKDTIKYEVLISCVEEPSTGLYYLTKFGIKFKPRVVMLGITLGNDLAGSYVGLDGKGYYILDDSTAEIVRNPNY